jgi:transposase
LSVSGLHNCRVAERNLVERFFLKIKHFRRIATRYEQTPRAFMSMLSIVSAFIWTK